MTLSKKDVLWSYIAQFLRLASGILILPLVLRMLSTEEIALNYLLTAVATLVALLDFGFSPQFGRNFTYVFCGAQELRKEGVAQVDKSANINYTLLLTIITTAKYVYLRIAILVVILLATLGTWYIHTVTQGFASVPYTGAVWCLAIVSSFFNFYYAYFDALLTGRGLITEAKKAMVLAKLVYIILATGFLYLGLGLLGIMVAGLISAFVYRAVSWYYFYDKDFSARIAGIEVDLEARKQLFRTLWPNARKLGLVFLSAYAINNFSMFLAGLFLPAADIASYGLLMQLVGIITAVSSTLFMSFNPTFSALRTSGERERLYRVFAFSMNVYYLMFISSAVFLILAGPQVLQLLGAKAMLPSATIMIAYCTVIFLEGNHSNFAALIVANNQVPFLKSSIIAGLFVVLGDYLVLAYTTQGVLGLILVQGLAQLCYANWKWPLVIFKEANLSVVNFLSLGFEESLNKMRSIYA